MENKIKFTISSLAVEETDDSITIKSNGVGLFNFFDCVGEFKIDKFGLAKIVIKDYVDELIKTTGEEEDYDSLLNYVSDDVSRTFVHECACIAEFYAKCEGRANYELFKNFITEESLANCESVKKKLSDIISPYIGDRNEDYDKDVLDEIEKLSVSYGMKFQLDVSNAIEQYKEYA